MNPKMLDRIETYVKAKAAKGEECTEDDVVTALGIHLFDALEGLEELQRASKEHPRGRLRSESIEPEPAPEPLIA